MWRKQNYHFITSHLSGWDILESKRIFDLKVDELGAIHFLSFCSIKTLILTETSEACGALGSVVLGYAVTSRMSCCFFVFETISVFKVTCWSPKAVTMC